MGQIRYLCNGPAPWFDLPGTWRRTDSSDVCRNPSVESIPASLGDMQLSVAKFRMRPFQVRRKYLVVRFLDFRHIQRHVEARGWFVVIDPGHCFSEASVPHQDVSVLFVAEHGTAMARIVLKHLDCLLSGTGPTSPFEQTPNRHVIPLQSRASASRSQKGGGEKAVGCRSRPRAATGQEKSRLGRDIWAADGR